MLSLHAINMDIRKEGRKILTVFSSEAKMKKIRLGLEFGQSMESSKVSGIKTDPVRLGQIVTNLISKCYPLHSFKRRTEYHSDIRCLVLSACRGHLRLTQ